MMPRVFFAITLGASLLVGAVELNPKAVSITASSSVSNANPPLPPVDVPDIVTVNPPVLCVDCDKPFDGITHKTILKGLVNNPYVGELRKALYLQDTYHQFESKAHFDNCDFEGATDYISALLLEAGWYVDVATKAQSNGDTAAMKKAALSAFFSIGQALHGTQDFYAHSNYVELQHPNYKKVTDIPIVFPWRAEGRARIKELQKSGLISGFVFWGVPQKCPSGSISHANLAKDSANTKSGKIAVTHLQNTSQYKIAVYLAREASLQLLTDSFRQWPLLKQLNGQAVAVDILVDRRGADSP
jgi:hypothetical protein